VAAAVVAATVGVVLTVGTGLVVVVQALGEPAPAGCRRVGAGLVEVGLVGSGLVGAHQVSFPAR
jgi:hypothetical protein